MSTATDRQNELHPRLSMSPDKNFLFSYEDTEIELYQKSYSSTENLVEKYNKIASDLEELLFFLKKFVDLEHVHFVNEDHGTISRTRVYLSRRNYRQFQRDLIKSGEIHSFGETKAERTWLLDGNSNDFFNIYYSQSGIKVKDINRNFLMLATADVPNVFNKKSLNVNEIIPLIMLLKNGVDTSLKYAGVEANMENRVNFVSLYMQQYFFKVTAINEITKVKKGAITKTAIAHAAAKGFNSTLLSMFYVNNFFSDDPEIIEQFNTLPLSWVDGALNSKD
jgi:hypothetical protein